MDISSKARERIAEEAIEWLLHLQSAACNPSDHAAFSEWLLRSPAHIEEYLAISTVWVGMKTPTDGDWTVEALIGAARNSGADNVVRLERNADVIEKSRPFKQGGRNQRWRIIGIAAAAVLITVVASIAFLNGHQASNFRTEIGEQRSISLPDGSVVSLNTNSEIRVHWTAAQRGVELTRDEARFRVAKEANRPFIVSTSHATIRAVGTIFNVRAVQATTEVAVMEGRVEVMESARPASSLGAVSEGTHRDPARLELAAGERAAVTISGIRPNVGPSIDRVTAWTERRLVFRGESLADVVAEFNRYRVKPVVVDDAPLAALRISGVFDSGDTDSLVAYLASFETVRVNRPADGSVHLSLNAPAAAPAN